MGGTEQHSVLMGIRGLAKLGLHPLAKPTSGTPKGPCEFTATVSRVFFFPNKLEKGDFVSKFSHLPMFCVSR